jgi:hypothetical protein
MKLYPQNLRDRQHATIIKRRTYGLQGKGTPEGVNFSSEAPPPRIGRLGRFWARRSGLTEKQAATGLPAASMSTLSAAYAPVSMVGLLAGLFSLIAVNKHGADAATTAALYGALTAALGYAGALPWAGAAFRSLYKAPLRGGEVDVLLEDATDATTVERSYLTLVRDAIRQNVPENVEPELRAAIEALGQAIDRLPAVSVAPLDTAALRAEADGLFREAAEQTDRVIADSLERRAEALRRRCDAHERSAQYVRRSAALRAEIEAQIEALREGLAAFDAGLSADVADMAHLSESARRVASEAVSAAAAREELAEVFGGPDRPTYTPVTTTEAPVQTVGSRRGGN